ncbi:unnamed protein product [Sphagnum balticum]
MENYPDRYAHISRLARKHIRNYITSIFLVKGAERKIKEMEILTRRTLEQVQKRVLEEEDRAQLDVVSPLKRLP